MRNSRPTATAYTREVLNLNLCSAKHTALAEACKNNQYSRKVLMGDETALDQREMQDKLLNCVQIHIDKLLLCVQVHVDRLSTCR